VEDLKRRVHLLVGALHCEEHAKSQEHTVTTKADQDVEGGPHVAEQKETDKDNCEGNKGWYTAHGEDEHFVAPVFEALTVETVVVDLFLVVDLLLYLV
jgi:hypothetical protein